MNFSDDVRRYTFIIGLVFGIGCIIFLIAITLLGQETETILYRLVNANNVFDGLESEMEYPPLALIFILIPRLLSSSPYGYNAGFVAELFIFFVIGLYMVGRLAERLNKEPKRSMLAYTLLMLFMFEFVVDRFDIIPVAVTLVSVYCYLTKRYTWAFVLLSLGTMIKLYPAVLFPVFIIPLIVGRDWKNVLKGTGAFVIASLAVLLPVIVFQPEMLSHFIGYHADRPLQIESVAASFIFLFDIAGLTSVTGVFGSGSENIVGAWPDAVAPLLTPLMFVSVVVVCVVFAYMLHRTKNAGEEEDRLFLFASAALLSVMAFIIVGKVFSSQYMMWIVPLLLFMFMTSSDREADKKAFILITTAMILAQAGFGYISGYLGGGDSLNVIGKILLIAKNIPILILFYFVAERMYRRYNSLLHFL